MKKRWFVLVWLVLIFFCVAGCGKSGESADSVAPVVEEASPDYAVRPVVFVHGGAGSASQFESQAQRFLANDYPLSYLGVYEYNTRLNPDDQVAADNAGINAVIDQLLATNNADKVDLIGHSMGTRVSQLFLNTPANAAKVAHYVNIDGYEANALPGGVTIHDDLNNCA
ncbi:MAG: alpha/beta fold hydrolase [Desulfobacteraceae bacterium]|nr:alpha/beta fold hydrolase [Desulfobacteraceae bacterium]